MVTIDDETGHRKVNELPGGHKTVEGSQAHLFYQSIFLGLVKK